MANRDGSDVRMVTDEDAAGFGFSWSSHAAALVARPARYQGVRRTNAVKVFDLDTGETRSLTAYREKMPELPLWAPGDDKIVLATPDRIELFDSGVPPAAGEKTWVNTPVYVALENSISRVGLDVGEMSILRSFNEGTVLNLAASPDGLKLTFEVMGGSLYVLNTDGSGVIDLGIGHRPRWSPDGRWIVFMKTEDDGYQFTGSELFVADARDGSIFQLTHTPDRLEMNPSWSPDGFSLAYDDRGNIFVLTLTTE